MKAFVLPGLTISRIMENSGRQIFLGIRNEVVDELRVENDTPEGNVSENEKGGSQPGAPDVLSAQPRHRVQTRKRGHYQIHSSSETLHRPAEYFERKPKE